MNSGPYSSKIAHLNYDVPQGSSLVPALFTLYTVCCHCGLFFHSITYLFHYFADDLQMYLLLKTGTDSLQVLLCYLEDVKL